MNTAKKEKEFENWVSRLSTKPTAYSLKARDEIILSFTLLVEQICIFGPPGRADFFLD